MDRGKPQGAGRPGENTLSARLAQLLRDRGFADADFERQFSITDPVSGRHVLRKPDVVFTDGGTHIVSAKVGERREREALSTAINYLRDLSPVTNLGEVFAVTYPERDEAFHFHVLPVGRVEEISLAFDSLEEVADAIGEVVRGRIARIIARQEPIHLEAGRLLRYTAEELSLDLKGVPSVDLEEIFGGHDFFHSALSGGLTETEREDALRLGPAYLFVNQILFYALLSQAARIAGTPEVFPPIEGADRGSPKVLRERYFDLVRQRDYEPIYGPDIGRHLDPSKVGRAVEQLVDALTRLAPKLAVPDLVGQVFQNLIPLSVRKPLGAYYTNPNAASLLARLAIDDPHSTVLDPSCGSGTLLVAAYRRKWALVGGIKPVDAQAIHKEFVERELTGVDAMAFSSHLAAVNLALQQPLLETDYVRIARADSTSLLPGQVVQPVGQSLPAEFKQATLFEVPTGGVKKRNRSRIPNLKPGRSASFVIDPVDVVIMNPPFTSQNNMSPEYRSALNLRFRSPAVYRELLFWKTSEQVYFILLADRFLRPGGRLAAVLPLTTFTGHAFHPLVEYLVKNYTIEVVVAGLGRCSFSEDTSLTECLVVARKAPPPVGSVFSFIGVETSPAKWTASEVDDILEAIHSRKALAAVGRVRAVSQTELLPNKSALSGLLLRLDPTFDEGWQALEAVIKQSRVDLIPVGKLFSRGVEMTEVYHGDYRPLKMGPKALIGCRDEDRAIKDTDRLVLEGQTKRAAQFRDRLTPESRYTFPVSALASCIRRFSGFSRMDVTGKTDFIVTRPCPELEVAMNAFYTKSEARAYQATLSRINWSSIIKKGSARVNIAARADLAGPGTIHLAIRSDESTFLAGAYGYNVKGFKTEREEKLFTLWLNSTFSLTQLIAKATITRGSWLKLEQFTTEQVLMPDPRALSESQWSSIEKLWVDLSAQEAPPLLEQLRGAKFRTELDRSLLLLLGLSRAEAARCADRLAKGTKAAVEMLLRTMVPP